MCSDFFSRDALTLHVASPLGSIEPGLDWKFSWTNGQNSQNTFTGTITRVVNNSYPATAASIYGYHYHLDGVVTSPTAGGPGHVSGDGAMPPLVAYDY